MSHLFGEPTEVVQKNMSYMFALIMGKTTTAVLMWWSYPVFLIYRFFRKRSFDFDFDEIEEEGKRFSNKQGLVYHYWGDARNQGLIDSYIVHVKDFWTGVIFGIPWLLVSIIYFPVSWISTLLWPFIAPIRFTITTFIKAFTPWKENDGETFILWWTKAIDLGLTTYDYEYTNRWLMPEA